MGCKNSLGDSYKGSAAARPAIVAEVCESGVLQAIKKAKLETL